MSKKIILVNQTGTYLFGDIINAFAERLPGYQVEAWYGTLGCDATSVHKSVQLKVGPVYKRNGFKNRMRTWFRFHFWMRKQLKGVDVKNTLFFFVTNPPLFVFLPGVSQMRFACLVYDLYPDVLLSGLKKNALTVRAIRYWEKTNRKVLPKAEAIFTLGEGLKQAIEQYLPPQQKDTVQVVSVWNQKANGSASLRDFKAEWGLNGKKIILYSGNIGLTHPLEYLIELAKKLQQDRDWAIVIVGDGSKKPQLQEQAAKLNNVHFKDFVPMQDLSALLSIATWGYVTLDTTATNSSVPSKTFNLLAAGIPLLAMVNDSSEIARLLDKYQAGIYFREHELDATATKILHGSEEERIAFSENARKCATHFTPDLAFKFIDNWINKNVPALP